MRPPWRTRFSELFLRVPFLAAYAAFAVPALGCRPDPPEPRGAAVPPATSALATAVTESAPDSFGLELVLPRRVRTGEPVPITLRVQNRTRHTIDLYLRGRAATFEVVVARPDGEVVWRRLEDEIILAIVHLRALAPAERLELATVWDQRTRQGRPVAPGEYTARGLLLVEGDPLETRSVPFRIVER